MADPCPGVFIPDEEALMQTHARLVHYVIRRDFSRLEIEYDDAVQIGMMGLLEAIRTHDPDRGASLSTYAVLCIKSALLKEYQTTNTKKRKAPAPLVRLDAPISEDDERTMQIADSSQDVEREATASAQVNKLMDRLGDRDREIAEMLMDGVPVSEISEITGLSRFQIDERVKKMRKIVLEEKTMQDTKENQGVKDTLATMNSHLFAQLERLGNGSLTGDQLREEVTRAKAMADISTRIIQSGELVLRAHVFGDKQVDKGSAMPRLLSGNE